MTRFLLPAALVAVFFAHVPAVEAAFAVAPPPAVLSPDLSDPWLLQMKPGAKTPTMSFVTRARPPAPAVAQYAAPPQPTLLTIPGTSEEVQDYPIDPEFLPQVVPYVTVEKPGTIIIDTPARHLYLVMPNGQALRYGVGVGRPGFEWAGVHTVTRMAEWPGWTPPTAMLKRQPDLPRHMDGGIDNPLGARAIYIGSTEYRIHGSNEPWTIGQDVSSGCIRMRNQDIIDLYQRVRVGAKVVVI